MVGHIWVVEGTKVVNRSSTGYLIALVVSYIRVCPIVVLCIVFRTGYGASFYVYICSVLCFHVNVLFCYCCG